MQRRRMALAVAAIVAVAVGAAPRSDGHEPKAGGHATHRGPDPTAPGPRAPRRVTMDELHRHGGVPRGWKFTVPPGDVARGRQVFADLECFKCHTIKGESFPAAGADPKNVGPDLTGMGGEHPAEYIAESILAPNHVIVEGPGHVGPDGLSVMPSFADSISLAQWVDLVAFLKSLTGGDGDGHHHAHDEIERDMVAGDYRVRVVFARGHGGDHAHHRESSDARPAGAARPMPDGHGPPGARDHARPGGGQPGATGAAMPRGPAATAPVARGHLMVFVVDREYEETVPYLPVTATIRAAGAAPRTVKLQPMTGARGFHYGADVTLPPRTEAIVIAIGPTAMHVMGTPKDRFKKAVSVTLDWPAKGK